MQGMVRFLLICASAALVTGCKDKNKDMEMDPTQSSSAAYQDPSDTYYAPDPATSGAGNESYTPAPTGATTGTGTHVVAKGDTLFSLARLYYGDQSKWKVIHEANRDVIKNPDLLIVGQKLVIP